MRPIFTLTIFLLLLTGLLAQLPCPEITSSDISPDSGTFCPGDEITLTWDGINLENEAGCGFCWGFWDSENEEIGGLIGCPYQVNFGACVAPEILYVMVDPDDELVGGPDDCNDEFIVLYIGGPRTRDCGGAPTGMFIHQIQLCFNYHLIGNYCPGSDWQHSYTFGNTSVFNCGIPLGPTDLIPENSILIIQTSPYGEVNYDLGEICNLGIPVYVIAIDTPEDCTGGFIPNSTAECNSCALLYWPGWCLPGGQSDYGTVGLDYDLPSAPVSGWGISNTLGGDEFGSVVPDVEVTEFYTGTEVIPISITWEIPSDFCEYYGPGIYEIQGGLDYYLFSICPESQLTTDVFEITISCPVVSAGEDIVICQGEIVTLEGDLYGNSGPCEWTTNGDGAFGDPSLVETTYTPGPNDISNGQVVLTIHLLACGQVSDDLILTIIDSLYVDAGEGQTICSDDVAQLDALISGGSDDPIILWTTDGDGVFEDVNALQTSYTPGLDDIENGIVLLTLTAIDPFGLCNAVSSTIQITIANTITIAGVPEQVCHYVDPPISLPTTQSGFSGNWTGQGVFDNYFNPFGLDGNIALTFIPDQNACVDNVTIYISVIALPVSFNLPSFICETGPPINLDSVAYLDTITNVIPGTWSGPGVFDNTFHPSGLDGEVGLIFIPFPVQCAITTEVWIFVGDGFIPEVSGVPPSMCIDDNPITLSTVQDGISGNWSGQGVTNNTFNPQGLNGSVTLVFTPEEGQCAEVVTTDIDIILHLIPDISGIPDSICQEAIPILLPTMQNGIAGNWSGQGVSNNIFNPAGLTGIVQLDFTPDTGQCAEVASTDIDVLPLVTPLISGIPVSLCQADNGITLPTIQTDVMGNWSGQGVSNNVFNPSGLSGDIILTFTPDTTQCAEAVTTDITVEIATIPLISGIPDSMCQSDAAIPLPTLQDGFSGHWLGSGVINNVFNPAGQSGLIILSFAPDTGQCAMVAFHGIDVDLPISPVISGIPSTLCESSAPISLSTIQNGIIGNWSGQGVSSNTFDPVGLTGDIVLTFTPDAGQCATIVITSISVFDVFIPLISGIPSSLCELSALIPLPIVQDGVAGDWTGPGVVNNTFDPTGQSGVVTLTFTPDAGQCADTATTHILIEAVFIPVITGVPDAMCQMDEPVLLPTIQDGITGTWSGQGVSNNTFNPSSLNGTINLIFDPDANQCADTVMAEIVVELATVPMISGVPNSLCQSNAIVSIPSVQDGIQGNWSGTGVIDNTFNANGLSGLITIVFTPDPDQCASVASTSIDVLAPIVPVITGIPLSVCQKNPEVSLPTEQEDIIGNWSGAGILNNIFHPSGQSGVIPVFFIPDPGQCADTGITQIVVNTPPSFINLTAACDTTAQTYVVSFDIIEGDPFSYTVNGNPIGGANFVSVPINADSIDFEFIVDDTNGCGPITVNGSMNCACATSAGTMNFTGSPLKICDGALFAAQHNGDESLDSDDLLEYVLHDQAGTQLGTIYASGNTPVFSVPPGIILGQTYYLSAIAGSQNGTGSIDFTDACLSVSQGIPVIFYKPGISLSTGADLCQEECITYSVQLYGEKPFEFTFQILANGIPTDQTLTSDISLVNITVCPSDYGVASGIIDILPLTLSDKNCSVALSGLPGSVSTIHAASSATISYALCPGTSIMVNETVYDESNLSGTEILIGGSASGCDSTVNINLTYYEPAIEDVSPTLCFGASLIINGTEYNAQKTMGTEVIPGGSIHGCDSIIQINLSFDSIVTENLSMTLCAGESLVVNGMTYDQAHPSGSELLMNGSAFGCDSLVNVALSFHLPVQSDVFLTLCSGESIVINGTLYDERNFSGIEIIPNGSVHGCDSSINVTLTFYPNAYSYVIDTLKTGDSLVVNGMVYDQNNPTGIALIPGGSVTGCDSIIEVSLYFIQALSVIAHSIPPECHGEMTGVIVLEGIPGGTLPYSLSLDGNNPIIVTTFPEFITGLGKGIHLLLIRDGNDNTLNLEIEIPDAPILEVNAGVDQTIQEGDNVQLSGEATFDVVQWEWSPAEFLSCTACEDPKVIDPGQSVTYTLTATDLNQCTASDDVTVILQKQAEVFIPNVFSPNGDGVNDTWTIYSEDADARIQQLVIYDRWGGIIFSLSDMAVNDPGAGWDGSANGSQVNPGVYVFAAELVTNKGKVTPLHGDITLFR